MSDLLTPSKTLPRSLLLRLEEALWSGVGGDGARGLVVLADVVRKTVRRVVGLSDWTAWRVVVGIRGEQIPRFSRFPLENRPF